ncbi:MAG: hypothetical protein DRP68_05335 [Candidatus Omnitrophota bacterium]|nr:MAG: hypothetical protein DRP68_05335 [Candidatus Omnitrophota bacterium]HDN86385.1 trigger factor family protein [Candidatus Omnitrophota bacterium]
MKVEVKKLDNLKRVIRVQVEGEDFKKDKSQLYRSLAKDLKVPGFRAGIAPLEILEKYHGKLLREEFIKWAIPNYYEKAVKEANISPVVLPRIYDVELTDKKFAFSAELEVKPQVSLEESIYKGIKVKDKPVDVKEQEWKKLVENLKEQVKRFTKKDFSDSEIAKWSGYPNYEVFQEALICEIKGVKLRQRRLDIESQIVNTLLKRVKITVPKRAAEEHRNKLLEEEIYKLKVKGISEEDIRKYKKDLEEKLTYQAQEQMKLYYILEAIAIKENLDVTPNNLYEVVMGYILSLTEFI